MNDRVRLGGAHKVRRVDVGDHVREGGGIAGAGDSRVGGRMEFDGRRTRLILPTASIN